MVLNDYFSDKELNVIVDSLKIRFEEIKKSNFSKQNKKLLEQELEKQKQLETRREKSKNEYETHTRIENLKEIMKNLLYSLVVSIVITVIFSFTLGLGLTVIVLIVLTFATKLSPEEIDTILYIVLGSLILLVFLISTLILFIMFHTDDYSGEKKISISYLKEMRQWKKEERKNRRKEKNKNKSKEKELLNKIHRIEEEEKNTKLCIENQKKTIRKKSPEFFTKIMKAKASDFLLEKSFFLLVTEIINLKYKINNKDRFNVLFNTSFIPDLIENKARRLSIDLITISLPHLLKEYLELFDLHYKLIIYLEPYLNEFKIYREANLKCKKTFNLLNKLQETRSVYTLEFLREKLHSGNVIILSGQQKDFERLTLLAETVVIHKELKNELGLPILRNKKLNDIILEEVNKPILELLKDYSVKELAEISRIYELVTEDGTNEEFILRKFLPNILIENENIEDLLFKEHLDRIKNSVINKGYILETLELEKLINNGKAGLAVEYMKKIVEFIDFINNNSIFIVKRDSYGEVIANINNFLELFEDIRQAKEEKAVRTKLTSQSNILRNQIDKAPMAKINIKHLTSPKGYNKDTTLSTISSLESDIIEIKTRKGTYYALHKHFEDEDSLKGKEQELLTDKELEVKLQSIKALLEDIERNRDILSKEEYFDLKNNYLSEEIMVKHTIDKRTGNTKSIICVHCSKPTSSIRKKCQHCNKELSICLICYNSISKGEKICTCQHCETIFHKDHIVAWLENSNQCPYCRKLLDIDLKVKILN